MKLFIRIPCLNEEETLPTTLGDLPREVAGFDVVEWLIIDDGSTDRTIEVARAHGVDHIVRLTNNKGLAAGFQAGLDACLKLGADVIVNTDADNQYAGADIAKLVAPIVRGSAEVVIGDREVAKSPHMSGFKRVLQRLGSWTVGRASGVSVSDVTSGFRAFSREAAMQINVFNPFTYTLETIIQSGNRNLGVQSVAVRTNAPTRPSRLFPGIGTYLRKSVATIFRIYTVYRPLKTFFAIGSVLMFAGVIIGGRFLWLFARGDRGGHIQSLILAAVFLIAGFQTWLIALLADLVAVNRRLSEEVLIRVKRLESGSRAQTRPQPQPQRVRQPQQTQQPAPPRREAPPAAPKQPETQWVWLMDEKKSGDEVEEVAAEETAQPPQPEPANGGQRRRRRRRGGSRQAADLPGNRGKHLAEPTV